MRTVLQEAVWDGRGHWAGSRGLGLRPGFCFASFQQEFQGFLKDTGRTARWRQLKAGEKTGPSGWGESGGKKKAKNAGCCVLDTYCRSDISS